jgi:hypothetical protein
MQQKKTDLFQTVLSFYANDLLNHIETWGNDIEEKDSKDKKKETEET